MTGEGQQALLYSLVIDYGVITVHNGLFSIGQLDKHLCTHVIDNGSFGLPFERTNQRTKATDNRFDFLAFKHGLIFYG